MTARNSLFTVGVLVLALTAAGQVVEAGQREGRSRDRGGRDSQGQARERSGGSGERSRRDSSQVAPAPGQQSRQAAPSGARRGDGEQDRGAVQAERPQDNRQGASGERDAGRDARAERGVGRAVPRRDGQAPRVYGADRNRTDRRDGFRYEPYRDSRRPDDRARGYYYSPRLIPVPRSPRHYYGSGGSLSVYYGWGSGYLFGSPYYGRVYGYSAPRAYGARIYYGDLRLQVRPRDAAVYVDGYYAGVVDDFDGVFQRLTLEVGPHEIEISAPGLEPQFYDVYVDPARTVTIRTDLYPY